MKTQYKARNGSMQYKPEIDYLFGLIHQGIGFCLACGEESGPIEPDVSKARCDCCGARKVYGGETLLLMGLHYSRGHRTNADSRDYGDGRAQVAE